MCLCRGKIIVAHVWTHFIVYSDNFIRPCPSLVQRGDNFPVEPFFLQDSVDSFSYCIFPGVSVFGHADLYTVFLEQIHIGMATILYTTIRVVNKLMTLRKFFQSHLQGIQRTFHPKGFRQEPSYNLMRIHVSYQTQIKEVAIRHP